jgi:hypothetical protein
MDAYETLRREAADKLDKAILAARKEYRETVAAIDRLRVELGHEKPKSGLRVDATFTDLVRENIPQDRPFTADDILYTVGAIAPNRRFKRGTLKSILHKLGDTGVIRRVAKDKQGYVLWAALACDIDAKPYEAMPMSDVIADVLHDKGPLRAPELVVAVQGLGYRADDDPTYLLRVVRKSLTNNPRRFQRAGDGRWNLAN